MITGLAFQRDIVASCPDDECQSLGNLLDDLRGCGKWLDDWDSSRLGQALKESQNRGGRQKYLQVVLEQLRKERRQHVHCFGEGGDLSDEEFHDSHLVDRVVSLAAKDTAGKKLFPVGTYVPACPLKEKLNTTAYSLGKESESEQRNLLESLFRYFDGKMEVVDHFQSYMWNLEDTPFSKAEDRLRNGLLFLISEAIATSGCQGPIHVALYTSAGPSLKQPYERMRGLASRLSESVRAHCLDSELAATCVVKFVPLSWHKMHKRVIGVSGSAVTIDPGMDAFAGGYGAFRDNLNVSEVGGDVPKREIQDCRSHALWHVDHADTWRS